MDTDALSIARWQFSVAWGLADRAHLPRLTDDVCLWQPHPTSWTVRRAGDGNWYADWSDPEPVDPAPPSIGWLTWHILWWWTDALAVVGGGHPADRASVSWPGSARTTVSRLRALAGEWSAALGTISTHELETPARFPWPEPRPLIYTISWVNVELMKNVAEIGEIANLFRARQSSI